MLDQEIDYRKASNELKKFTNYSSAIKYIKNLPVEFKVKSRIYANNQVILKRLKDDDTNVVKEVKN